MALTVLFILSPYVNETMQEKQLKCLVLLAIGYILLFAVACPMYSTPHATLVFCDQGTGLHSRHVSDAGTAGGCA